MTCVLHTILEIVFTTAQITGMLKCFLSLLLVWLLWCGFCSP